MVYSMKERIILIGAGSAVFTRGLLADLIRRDWDVELALVDIDESALEVAEKLAGKLAGKILHTAGKNIPILASTDRRRE